MVNLPIICHMGDAMILGSEINHFGFTAIAFQKDRLPVINTQG